MSGLFTRLGRYRPRRRRVWQYVSSGRHGLSLMIFAGLLAVAAGYWHFTNDARVEREVEAYIERLVPDAHVRIRHAHFTLFEGVRVDGIRVYLGKEGANLPPFLESPQVMLRFSTSQLLLTGHLDPTEIICDRPRVVLIEDVLTRQLNVQQIFPIMQGERSLSGSISLPPIRLRGGELVRYDREGDQLLPVGRTPLTVALLPDPDGKTYNLRFDEQSGAAPAISGTGVLDLSTGQTRIDGWVGLQGLDRALPRQYRQWRQRYALSGPVNVVGEARLGAVATDTRSAVDKLTARLAGVSLTLPPEQGGLRLEKVEGEVVFDSDGITIANLTASVPQAGNAAIALTGRYDGYENDSPFKLAVKVTNLRLPLDAGLAQSLGETVTSFQETYAPHGLADASVTLQRASGKAVEISGELALKDMTGQMPSLNPGGKPIAVEKVNGKITLDGPKATFESVRCQILGETGVTVAGWANAGGAKPTFDISASITNLPFTEEVKAALPKEYAEYWTMYRPQGHTDLVVKVRQGAQDKAPIGGVDVHLTGKASFEYFDLPYRIGELHGELDIGADLVAIKSIQGRNGPARFTINGQVTPAEKDSDFEIHIDATGIPLDEQLGKALSGPWRRLYTACGLTGQADMVDGVIACHGGKVDYKIPMALKGVAMRPEQFPYAVDAIAGTATISPGALTLGHLVGRHGRAKLDMEGAIALAEKDVGLHLRVAATELTFDDGLYQALPPAARAGWDQLAPAGTADVTMKLDMPPGDAPLEYRLTVSPRDLRVKFRAFPYPLRLSKGSVSVGPEGCTLDNLAGSAGEGDAEISVSGKVGIRPGEESAELAIQTGAVPVDAALIAAIPAGLAKVLDLKPGGTIKLDLKNVAIGGAGAGPSPTSTSAPATARGTASAPATQPPPDQARYPATRETATTASAPATGIVLNNTSHPATATSTPTSKAAATSCPTTASSPTTSTGPTTTSAPAREFAWRVRGRVTLDLVTMGMGISSKQYSGYLDGEAAGAGDPKSVTAKADIVAAEIVVQGRKVNSLTAKLAKKPGGNLLRIDDIAADAFGGKLAGRVEIVLGATTKYGLSLTVSELDLADFINSGRPPDKRDKDIQGLLTGTVQMTGAFGDDASRLAAGKLQIRQGKIVNLPVVLGFLNVINLVLPNNSGFQSADIDYYLRAQTLVFREIHLQGPAMSMVGAGKIDLATDKVSLTFLSGPKLPHMAGLEEVLQAISGQILTIRVTGKLDNPIIKTVPLRGLDETLGELHNPEGMK